MDTVNVHDMDFDTTKVKVTNRFNWEPHTFKIFLEECMTELKNRNRASSYFKSTVCQNICKRLLERTGKELDRNQMKNKWDIMRKEFKYYDHLTRLETGISVDPEDKEFAKFKDKNLDVYQTYYEALFQDTIAIGDKAKVPCEFGDNNTPNDVQIVDIMDGKEDTDEVLLFDDVDPFFTIDSSKKSEEKSEGKSMANSSYEQKLDTVFDVLLTRSTQPSRQTTQSPTTEECMAIVSTFLGFEEGSIGYLEALEVFLKKPTRQNFMVPKSDETKMEFLKRLIEKEK
ncbi:uncharacterized protein LOC111919789 [Lactuca sativa]|uniref:uncharacterized protein LOC111919789 n=1 Tax=Lactuca sativa TaxID=4236 RepID=UPI000CD98DF1|nr:uncharacterized protein LOC111919789 [Lactuca sativa]